MASKRLLERIDQVRRQAKAPDLPPLPLDPHVVRFPGGLFGVTTGQAVPLDGRAMTALARQANP